MRKASILVLGFLGLGLLAACSAPSDDAAADTSDIRKRINPNAGTAAFEVDKPTWMTDAFASTFRFDGAAIPFGTAVERAAGNFSFQSGIAYRTASYGPISFSYDHEEMLVPLQLGMISVYTPAGFVIHYSRPVTAGASYVLGTRQSAAGSAQNVIGFYNDELKTAAAGASVLMLDGHYTIESSADAVRTFDVAEGEKKEIVLPTATLALAFETIDATYPGTSTCLTINHIANNTRVGGVSSSIPVARGAASSTTSYVVPAGSQATLQLSACGEVKTIPATADAAISVTVHRLEVNDLDVVDPNGVHRSVHGTFALERKKADGSYTTVLYSEPTHTGVDITDGTYRVTSTAANVTPNVQEVTFP